MSSRISDILIPSKMHRPSVGSVLLIISTQIVQFCIAKSLFASSDVDNRQCECVPQHLCLDNDVTSGQGLLDIRFEDDICPNYYHVCCDPSKITIRPPPPLRRSKCGIQKSAGLSPRITSNSEIAQFAELPWTVLVLQKDRRMDRAFICGGSLVHPQVVITAAHCVASAKPGRIKVRAGEWNIRTTDEPLPHQDNSVAAVVTHPDFRSDILWNDVAMLFLVDSFVESGNVGFACLPRRGMRARVGENRCLACGWGKNAFQKGRHSAVLRKVDVPLVQRSKCQMALRSTRLGKFYKLHRSFICAGGERNKDTCKGDGGSPLVCPVIGQEDRFVQMGIVSWGIGCGAKKTPGVYVHLPVFSDWIDGRMMERNLSTSYYTL